MFSYFTWFSRIFAIIFLEKTFVFIIFICLIAKKLAFSLLVLLEPVQDPLVFSRDFVWIFHDDSPQQIKLVTE